MTIATEEELRGWIETRMLFGLTPCLGINFSILELLYKPAPTFSDFYCEAWERVNLLCGPDGGWEWP